VRPSILALDLEGTLISNAVSQIPRPGLNDFLEAVREHFDKLVMYTTVPDDLFRRISSLLVQEGHVPSWFSELECTQWAGPTKDLRYVAPVLGQALLFDDHVNYVHPGQHAWWIEVPLFASPYQESDDGLKIALHRIEQRLSDVGR